MAIRAVNGTDPPVGINGGSCNVLIFINLCNLCLDVCVMLDNCLDVPVMPPKCPLADFGHHSHE